MTERIVPPRTLPVVYFAFAHLCLALAFLLPALQPEAVAGFFYHRRMFTAVHLVTLGWITCSILGATYIVAPLALRTPLRAGKLDAVACGLALAGVAGVVAHFQLQSYHGVSSSGAFLLGALLLIVPRLFRALARSGSPLAIRLFVGCAYANLLLAGLLGVLLAENRENPFLPGPQLEAVFGHVHLAAVGWAAMMVVGVGYRLLPMLLPAAPPTGRSLWICLALLQAGVLGLGGSFLAGGAGREIAAVAVAAGLCVFVFDVVRMKRSPRPPPKKLRRPDFGVLHALQAVAYLALAMGIGLYLVLTPGWQLDWLWVYGVFGLVGFLAQVVIGVAMRLFPMFAWTEAYVGSGFSVPPRSPHEMAPRSLQAATLVLWSAGTPLLAWGLARDAHGAISAGAWCLFAATAAAAASSARVLRAAY